MWQNQIVLQKKLSINKVIGGKPKIAEIVKFFGANPESKVMPMARFFGTASGKKTGVSDFGEWVCLTGQFRAINIATGETSDSGVCFLPDVAQDMILGALDGGAQAVDFAFDIGVRLDESSATGYVYAATPVLQEENNPITRLEEKLKGMALPQLAAPAAPADPEGEKSKGKK